MMMAFVLQQANITGPTSIPTPSEEVVVIGRRLGIWRGTITSNPLSTHCRTDKTTGDLEIDKIGCGAMMACWPAARSDYKQARDHSRSAVERERLAAAADAAFADCIKTHRQSLILSLAEKKR